MLRSVAWRFVDNELLEPDFAKFRDLARRPQPITTLHRATHGQPERSARYRQIHRDLGFGAELRAVFRTGTTCWGSVALVRAQGQPDFSREEVAFVARLCDHIGLGLRLALLGAEADNPDPTRAPGLIVLGDDIDVVAITREARHWLSLFRPDARTGLKLPAVICAVARRARAAVAGSGNEVPAAARVRLLTGRWLVVHAAPLADNVTDDQQIAIMLVPAGPVELTPLQLDLYELTDREKQVARQLIRGSSADDIARALYISRYTVKDHTKAIYAKVGVTNRAELAARVFNGHHLRAFSGASFHELTPATA